MIYTLGYTKNYEDALDKANEEGKPVIKIGKRSTYAGGCCFKTVEDAATYRDKIGKKDVWSVYGLLADWDTDTEQGEEFNCLLKDSPIVRLEHEMYTV